MSIISRKELYSISPRRLENQPLLSINRSSYLCDELEFLSEDTENKIFLEKNNHTCKYCGFTSLTNKVLLENKHDKAVICKLCAMPTAIGFSLQNKLGELYILPEITQTEVNNLFRWFFLAEYADEQYQNKSSWIHEEDKDFQNKIVGLISFKDLKTKFCTLIMDRGESQLRSFFNTTVPSQIFFPMMLNKIDDKTYEERSRKLASLKFIPNRDVLSDGELKIILKEVNFSLNDVAIFYDELGQS